MEDVINVLVGSRYGVIDDDIVDIELCMKLDVSMLLTIASNGNVISIQPDAITIDFQTMESSFERSDDELFCFCNADLVSNPNNLSANISAS